jgi:hypothetical protein
VCLRIDYSASPPASPVVTFRLRIGLRVPKTNVYDGECSFDSGCADRNHCRFGFGRGIVEEDFGGKTAACGNGVLIQYGVLLLAVTGLDQLGSMGPSAKGYAGGRKGFGIFFRNCNGGGAAGSRWLRGIQSVQKCDFQYGIGELENEP